MKYIEIPTRYQFNNSRYVWKYPAGHLLYCGVVGHYPVEIIFNRIKNYISERIVNHEEYWF